MIVHMYAVIASAKEVMFFPLCVSVCLHDNSISCVQMLTEFFEGVNCVTSNS